MINIYLLLYAFINYGGIYKIPRSVFIWSYPFSGVDHYPFPLPPSVVLYEYSTVE